MKLTLATIGAAALLLWSGAGIAGWFATQEHVTLVFEEGEPSRATEEDPVDVLTANVASLGDDLRVLTRVLEQNFALLDENGAARTAETRAVLQGEITTVRARLDALDRTTETHPELLAELRELRSAIAVATEEAVARETTPPPAGPEEAEVEAPVEPLATEIPVAEIAAEEIAAEEIVPTETLVPPPSRSFLAFDLPSDDFRFDERRTWTIVPSLSRVGFDGTSTLHDFTGKTSAVEGELELDLSRPDREPRGTIRVEAGSLRTGSDGRDKDMLEHLAVKEHSALRFSLSAFDVGKVDAEARTVSGTARGSMTIRGVSRDVTMPVRARIDESRRLFFEGEMPLRLPDYDVPVSNKLGLVKMDEEVRVWIALRAKLVPRETP